jgi:CubicO group peptidase (beta-lactamase class C family)
MSLSVVVVSNGEKEYYNFGKTEVNGKDVDENTLYEIGSLTKVFTGTLLADMALDNLIDLNEPAQTYLDSQQVVLPEFNGVPIRIIDLATHTSGLPKIPVGFKDSLNPYADLDIDRLYKDLNAQVLFREPGTKYQYSNYGLALLGHILCSIENQSYDQLLDERIGKQLNLESTKVNLSVNQSKAIAHPHSITQRKTEPWDFKVYEGAGGLKSSSKDMGKFLLAHLQSLDIPSLDKTVELTQQIYFDDERKMGLTWHMGSINRENLYDHTGETGGYMSYMAIVPNSKVGIYLVTNCKKQIKPLGDEILQLILTDQNLPNKTDGEIL